MACLLLPAAAGAADTDLFAQPAAAGDVASVLFVIDTGASFSAANAAIRCGIDGAGNVQASAATVTAANRTALDGSNGAMAQCALYSALKAMTGAAATVNVGVMMFNAGQSTLDPRTGGFSQPCGNARGGCLVVPMAPLNTASGGNILNWVKNWTTTGRGDYNVKAPAQRGDGAVMQEAWAYLSGRTGISGRDYAAIASTGGCAGKYVVFIGTALDAQESPGDGASDAASPRKALDGGHPVPAARANPAATTAQLLGISDTRSFACGTGSKTAVLDPGEGKGAYALNWARYMKAQGITTYAIGVTGNACDPAYVAHLDKLGSREVGGGKYFGTTTTQELASAVRSVLDEAQAVSSVFASVSLPASVNSQGAYLNQVFVGMFRPDRHFLPRWSGNLKQYRLGLAGGTLRLHDADGKRAIDGATGFIADCARSYWTPTAADDYWGLDPAGGCASVAGSRSSNSPDGKVVDKGGQAHVLRSVSTAGSAPPAAVRKVKTCSPSFAGCTSLTDFQPGNAAISQALLNSGGADRDLLINWLRGSNLEDELDKGAAAYRPSVHGDVVHSRPLPVNHGTDTAPNIVVYYGGNDGMLRAVNGNRDAAISSKGISYPAGAELWSFVPPEFYPVIKRLKANSQPIAHPGAPAGQGAAKDYGIDGPITALQGNAGGSASTYVYAAMRRGGRVVYAFDVTKPGEPELLWKKGCPNAANDADCSPGYGQVGETWSSPKSMFAHGYGSGNAPLLVMGGGYDACEDQDASGRNHGCTSASTKGNRVFVLDAQTGALVKAFTTERAVVADVTLVRDAGGKVIYGYTADLGGNVYRLVFGTAGGADVSGTWTITKIASLGCASAACSDAAAHRKFMFAPSVVTADTIGSGAETYHLLLGSGDREKPVASYAASRSVQNQFYMLKDKPGDSGWLAAEAGTCGAAVICQNSLHAVADGARPTEAQLAARPKGWALRMDATEQVVTSAVTVFGVVTFSTHQPAGAAPNTCGNHLGTTRVYSIGYLDASSANKANERHEELAGGGLPPSPVAGRVTLDDGTMVPFCIGCSKDSALEGGSPRTLGKVTQPTGRLYWFRAR
jgi:type IV pilus assembly protein PilY1